MEITGKVAVVTGGGSGIGAALARRLAEGGARGVAVADIDLARAQAVADEINRRHGEQGACVALAVACDVGRESDIQALIGATKARLGQIDLFFSNAGIIGRQGGIELEDALWNRMWDIHVMAHVWAARAVVPEMVARGSGGFVVTASAAGLLNIVESAPYGVTKHAAVGFAEWLRIAYGRQGVQVACLCPQAVDTEMTRAGAGSAGLNGVLPPEDVAEEAVAALREGRFLALPHAQVAEYIQAKASAYDRWLGGMQKLYAQFKAVSGLGASG